MSYDATLGRFTTVCRREGNIPEIRIPVDPVQIQQTIERWPRIEQDYLTRYPNGTPFVVACEFGHVSNVQAAISATLAARRDVTAMVNFEGRNSYGTRSRPLMVAASNEHSAVVKILLDKNADVATTDQHGRNALHIAAYSNRTNTTTVGLLLEKMKLEDINHIDEDEDTPLDACYEINNSSIKQQLIELIREKGGKRANESTYEAIVEKIKIWCENGTPFVCACEDGRVEDVKAMIKAAREAGMDVKAMLNNVGTTIMAQLKLTPLMAAAWGEHVDIIKILLENETNTATTDNNGWNALHWAAQHSQINTTTVGLLLEKMKLEDINHKDVDEDTPLDICYDENNDSPIREELIDLIELNGGKRASELRASNSDGGSNKRQKTQSYLTLSNLKF